MNGDLFSGIRDVQNRISSIEQRFQVSRWVFSDELEAALDETVTAGDVIDAGTDTVDGLSTGDVVAAARAQLLQTFAPTGSTLTADDGAWIRALPEAGQEWAGAIADAARASDLDPQMLAALVWQESNFDAASTSRAGALGLTQLMPATAALLGVDPTEPLDNLAGGARFLSEMLDRYDGDVELALAAYNAGPSRVDAAGGIPDIAETAAYVPAVLARLRDLTSTSSTTTSASTTSAALRAATAYASTGALR